MDKITWLIKARHDITKAKGHDIIKHCTTSKHLITAGSLTRKQATVQAKLGKSDRTF